VRFCLFVCLFFSLLACLRRVGTTTAPSWRSGKKKKQKKQKKQKIKQKQKKNKKQKQKQKKQKTKNKKQKTTRTPEFGESYRYRVGHWYFAKNGVSVQPSLPLILLLLWINLNRP